MKVHHSDFAIIALVGEFYGQTFYVHTSKELEYYLKVLTFAWCKAPDVNWENGKPPKWKELYKQCLADRDFGDIATILQYDENQDMYFEW